LPAQPTALAIHPNSIAFVIEISFGAAVRLARPDLHLARAILKSLLVHWNVLF